MADYGILLDCLMLFIILVIGPPVTFYLWSPRFQTFINTKVNDLRSAYPRIRESMYVTVLWYLLVTPLCSISIGIAAWKFLHSIDWRFKLEKIYGVLSDIRIVTASGQESLLQAGLSRQKDILHTEHLARESSLRAEHSAEIITLRNQLAEQERMTNIARQRSYGPRQSRKQTASKFFSPPTAATACPGIFVPTVVRRATPRRKAEPVSNSIQTVEVEPTYMHAATNTTSGTPAERHATSSFSPLMTVQVQPQDQQPVLTKSATLSFSSIKAVHTIVPEPVYKGPATETTDAGVQAGSTDLVSRDELVAQAERHAFKIAAVEETAKENLAAQKRDHDTKIANLKTDHSSKLHALKTQQDRHDDEIATLTLSHSTEVAEIKWSKEKELKAQKERYDSEIDSVKLSQASNERAVLKAQRESHDLQMADVKSSYSTEITKLKSSQSSNIVTAQDTLALYMQEGIKLQNTVNHNDSQYSALQARYQSTLTENNNLHAQLQAAKVEVAAGASQEAVKEYLQKMQNEYQHKLEAKDKDIARVRKGRDQRVASLEAERNEAEVKAKEVSGLRHEIARLKMQVNKGTLPGLTTPSDGSRKGAKKLELELEQMKEVLTKAEFQRDGNWHCWKRDSDKMKVFEQEKLAAMAEVGKLETENARYREALGVGARTIVAGPSVNAKAGNKRGAQEEMSGGAGKRMR